MCGRYASMSSRRTLLEQFVVDDDQADELRGPDYDVAPTKQAPVVIARAPKDASDDEEPVRQLRSFRWGLLPNLSLSPHFR
jgi:putative SOS response-associated peptidase YedK